MFEISVPILSKLTERRAGREVDTIFRKIKERSTQFCGQGGNFQDLERDPAWCKLMLRFLTSFAVLGHYPHCLEYIVDASKEVIPILHFTWQMEGNGVQ